MIADGAPPAHEVRKARRRASDEAPQQAEDQRGQDRAARPDVPVGVVVLDRPPAEQDQRREQPVENARRQVPDRPLGAAGGRQWGGSDRYLSWHGLQDWPRAPG